MLDKITLTNFQRHENLTVEFAPGLNAVKAANERGKSTLLRAVAYALFGTRALPVPLDETVTWGKPVGSLKVELWLSLRGAPMHIVRSKSGAELHHEDGTVTGQVETARFIADWIGADAVLAGKLLLAGQNDIRGALAEGSRGAVELIEKLADFRQLDDLLALLQDKLVSGSPAALKGRLEQAEKALAEAKVEPVDEVALNIQAEALEKNAAEAAKAVRESVETLRAAEAELSGALREQAERQTRAALHAERKQMLERIAAEEPENPAAEPEDLAPLERAVHDATKQARIADLYAEMQRVNVQMDDEFPERFSGSAADLRAKLDALGAAAENADDLIYELGKSLATAKAMIQTGSCTTCGQDLSNFPHVAEANRKWQEQVDSCQAKVEQLREEQRLGREQRNELTTLLDANSHLHSHRAVQEGLARLLDETVPAQLAWYGPATHVDPSYAEKALTQAHTNLSDAKERNANLLNARRAHADWQRRVEKAAQAVKEVEPLVQNGPLPDIAGLTANVESARRGQVQMLARHEHLVGAASLMRREVDAAIHAWRVAQAARANAEREAAQCRDDLARLEFNNALLAAVRQARPLVANRLWSLVLAAVSTYFSEMRGAPAVVTREGGNFLVDGHPIESLSGSTLDALGLAVRVALMRTFLPTLSLLILDEPNAAMDEARTAQVLGFIAATGFAQTLIVSHDDMTASVADHIITLE